MEPDEKDKAWEPTLKDVMEILRRIDAKVDLNSERLSVLENDVAILKGEKSLAEEEEKTEGIGSRSSRKTMFEREVEEASTAPEGEQRMVVINMPPPEFKHIYLDSTDLANFSNFLIQWLEWERTYSLKLEPPRIMSCKLRTMLQYNHGLTDSEFFKLTPELFMKLMAKETKVQSKREFADCMRQALRYLRPLNWGKVNPGNHQKFFQGILRRRELFMKVFQIIMENNSDHCPEIKGRKHGLAQIFLDLISETYNESVLSEIDEVNKTNYPKIGEFVDAFVAKAKEHYEVSQGVKRVPYTGSDFKPEERRETSQQDFVRKDFKKPGKPSNRDSSIQRVNHTNNWIGDESDSDDEVERRPMAKLGADETDSDEEGDQFGEERGAANATAEAQPEPEPPDPFEAQLKAISDSSPSTRGCVNYAIYGNCFRGDECKNAQGHNEQSAKQTREWLIKKLATVERDGYQKTVLKRDQTKA